MSTSEERARQYLAARQENPLGIEQDLFGCDADLWLGVPAGAGAGTYFGSVFLTLVQTPVPGREGVRGPRLHLLPACGLGVARGVGWSAAEVQQDCEDFANPSEVDHADVAADCVGPRGRNGPDVLALGR